MRFYHLVKVPASRLKLKVVFLNSKEVEHTISRDFFKFLSRTGCCITLTECTGLGLSFVVEKIKYSAIATKLLCPFCQIST